MIQNPGATSTALSTCSFSIAIVFSLATPASPFESPRRRYLIARTECRPTMGEDKAKGQPCLEAHLQRARRNPKRHQRQCCARVHVLADHEVSHSGHADDA